ncbi:MAG: Mth938-like domain-containing protein [Woeseiaceae bacterium]
MQITRDRNFPITVRHVEPGELRVGDEIVRHNVLLTVDREIREWTAPDVEHLVESDFAELFQSGLETILLGTGWKPVFPPRQLVFALARRGIGFETMTTPAACHTFNILVNEGRRAAAILIVNEP